LPLIRVVAKEVLNMHARKLWASIDKGTVRRDRMPIVRVTFGLVNGEYEISRKIIHLIHSGASASLPMGRAASARNSKS
jgi:hypothetical protein